MVDRCKKEIVAVDLDGTLYAGSTLKQFVKFGLRCALNHFDWAMIRTILWHSVKCRMRIIDHRKMKHAIVSGIEKKITEGEMAEFVSILKSGLNRNVVNLINRKQCNGTIVVLTTASPMSYSRLLAVELGFDDVCATVTTDCIDSYIENRGKRKVETIQQVIKRHNGRLAMVITDHSDDIPLMCFNTDGDNILVNPRKNEVEKINGAGVRFVMIDSCNQL